MKKKLTKTGAISEAKETLTLGQRTALHHIQSGGVRFWETDETNYSFRMKSGVSLNKTIANSLINRGYARCRYNHGELNGVLEITEAGKAMLSGDHGESS